MYISFFKIKDLNQIFHSTKQHKNTRFFHFNININIYFRYFVTKIFTIGNLA